MREQEQRLGHNITGWVEKDETGKPYLMLRVDLEWDKETLTKKGFPSLASTGGRQKILEYDNAGVMRARDEWISMAVWIGKKKGYTK